MVFNSLLEDKVLVTIAVDRFWLSETLGVATIGENVPDDVAGLETTDSFAMDELSKSIRETVADCC